MQAVRNTLNIKPNALHIPINRIDKVQRIYIHHLAATAKEPCYLS